MKNTKARTQRRWPDADKAYLKEHYHNTAMEVLREKINRPAEHIHRMAHRLNITGKRYSVNNYQAGRADKPKVDKELKKGKEGSRNPNRWDRRKMKIKPFDTTGKKLVRVDRKTSVYVSIDATEQQIESIVSRYRKTA